MTSCSRCIQGMSQCSVFYCEPVVSRNAHSATSNKLAGVNFDSQVFAILSWSIVKLPNLLSILRLSSLSLSLSPFPLLLAFWPLVKVLFTPDAFQLLNFRLFPKCNFCISHRTLNDHFKGVIYRAKWYFTLQPTCMYSRKTAPRIFFFLACC